MAQSPTTFAVDGAAICTKRMNAGKAVEDLAAQTGITANYLRKLERGDRAHMRPGPYQALRAALNANETELLAAPHADPHEERK